MKWVPQPILNNRDRSVIDDFGLTRDQCMFILVLTPVIRACVVRYLCGLDNNEMDS